MPYPDTYTARAYNAGPGRTLSLAVVVKALDAHVTNARVRFILETAISDLERCDLDTHSMAPGYDLTDIVAGLRDMLPRTDDAAVVAKLDEWAADRVGECVA
jgi:hypothetical protein